MNEHKKYGVEMEIQGSYKTNGKDDVNEQVVITKLSLNQYRVENPRQWDGVGIFDGAVYYGIFRYKDTVEYDPFRGLYGIHKAVIRSDGSFAVRGSFLTDDEKDFDVVWIPEKK